MLRILYGGGLKCFMFDALRSQLKQHWPLITKYISLALFMGCLSLAIPIISGRFIDHIIMDYNTEIFVGFVIAIAITNLLQMVLRYVRAFVSTKTESTLTYTVSNALFQKYFTASCTNLRDSDSAATIDRISKDSHAVVRFFLSNVVELFLQTLTICVSAAYILHIDVLLSLIIFLLIPLYILSFYMCRKKMHVAKKEYKQAVNQYFSSYSVQVNKLFFIKRNSLAQEMDTRLKAAFNLMLGSSLKTVRTDYIFANANQFFIVIAYICITAIGGYRVAMQTLTIGVFTVINTYFNMIIHSISYFLNLASTYQEAKVSIERIKETLSMPDEATGSLQIDEITSIEVNNLCVKYETKPILSLDYCCFLRGKVYGIVGENGSGKTTLVNTLIGLCTGDCFGEISYSGKSIKMLDMKKMRRTKISYLEQEPTMLNMKGQEYLMFGVEENSDTEKKQQNLLGLWNINYLANRELNENGTNLSGGERKKLALVRAISKNADVFILDEPTAALDTKAKETLIELLASNKTKSIIIVISHDPVVLQACDSIFEIGGGFIKRIQ